MANEIYDDDAEVGLFRKAPANMSNGPEGESLLPSTGQKTGGLTGIQASVNLVKCAIGAGSFSLPYAFLQGGLVASFVGTLALGWLSAYTVTLLAWSERAVWNQYESTTDEMIPAGKAKFTYPELGRRVFPNFATAIGSTKVNWMEIIVYAGIALTSLGVCAAYVDFITGTLPAVIPALTNDGHKGVLYSSLILAPIMMALAQLRTYKFLSFTSLFGDIAVTAGIVSVVVYGCITNQLHWDVPLFAPSTFPKFFGSTSFLFAIHIVILPIMQSMERHDKFAPVAYSSYSFITILNAIFGALCYLLFAANTDSNVIGNLAGNGYLSAVRVMLCVDLCFSIPMVLAAGREVVEEPSVLLVPPAYREWYRGGLRTVLVGLVFVICFGVPNFGDMVGLVGGLVNSLMGFVLPPLIYLRVASRKGSLSWRSMAGHGAIVVFGIVALVVSTMYTVEGIIQEHKHPQH